MRSSSPVVVAAALLIGTTLGACDNESNDAVETATTTTTTDESTTTTTDESTTTTIDGESTTTTSKQTSTVTSTPTSTLTSTPSPDGGAAADAEADQASPPARLDPQLVVELDADGFAARLSTSHRTMVDPSATTADRARAGVDHQLTLRELAGRPDLDDDVLAAVDAGARSTLEVIVGARQLLQARSAARPPSPLPDQLPAWTIIEPEPNETLLAHYGEAEQLTGVAWYWLAAIHLQETRMGRIDGISSAGAVGPMQFLPTTWEVCCVGDPRVSRDAIIGAATYLAQSGGPDDMAAALYQYNPNDGYVAVVTAYAERLRDEPELYAGYHGFQVFFGTSVGTVRLPVGYSESAPIDAAAHLEANPQDTA